MLLLPLTLRGVSVQLPALLAGFVSGFERFYSFECSLPYDVRFHIPIRPLFVRVLTIMLPLDNTLS